MSFIVSVREVPGFMLATSSHNPQFMASFFMVINELHYISFQYHSRDWRNPYENTLVHVTCILYTWFFQLLIVPVSVSGWLDLLSFHPHGSQVLLYCHLHYRRILCNPTENTEVHSTLIVMSVLDGKAHLFLVFLLSDGPAHRGAYPLAILLPMVTPTTLVV